MTSTPLKKIVVFLVLTFALSAIFYARIIASGSIQGYSWGLMWCPGLAALLTQLLLQRNIRGLGWSIKPSRYWLLGYGVPLAYGLIVYGTDVCACLCLASNGAQRPGEEPDHKLLL